MVQRQRNAFWLYWGSMATSSFGTAVTTLGMPLLALNVLRASPFEVSLLVGAVDFGWVLLGLSAGVIVQRSRIRRLQVSMGVSARWRYSASPSPGGRVC